MKLKSLLFILVIAFFPAFISCEKDEIPNETDLQINNNTSMKYAVLIDSEITDNVESASSCSFKVLFGTHKLQCICDNGHMLDTILYLNTGVIKVVEFYTDNSGNCHYVIYEVEAEETSSPEPVDPFGSMP